MLLPPTADATELIEVVHITDVLGLFTSDKLLGEEIAIWDGIQVQQILALIGELPDGIRYRCFVPTWGMRAHSSTGQLFEVAFCFRCHSARIWEPNLPREHLAPTFDAESAAARQLLEHFRSAVDTGTDQQLGTSA